MNILKALRRTGIPVLALGAFLASCTEELSSEAVPGGGGGKTGESEVTLRLQVPGIAAGNKTRMVSVDSEREVKDLYVLAFRVDDDLTERFDYCVTAKKGPENLDMGTSDWTASLMVKEYPQTFVMIANALGTTEDVNEQIKAFAAGGKQGTEKMELLKTLSESLNADEQKAGFKADANGHHPFTMYGQTDAQVISAATGVNLTVMLHRIMARVNVTFSGNAAQAGSFEAESVSLYNFNGNARVIPDNLQMTDETHEKLPTLPETPKRFPETVDGNEEVPTYTPVHDDKTQSDIIHRSIYLFETAQPKEGTDEEKHNQRPCLIVKGIYQGTSCYYRIDFARTEYKDGNKTVTYYDIVRNHSYNVTVTNVTGRGHATAREAFNAPAANMVADIVQWDDNVIGNIDFDGDKVLGVATARYELGKAGGIKLQQVKAVGVPEWAANLYKANGDGTPNTQETPDWINFTDADGNNPVKTTKGTGDGSLQDVYFKVNGDNPEPERKAVMRFTAGKLTVDVLVVQNQKVFPVFINVTQAGLPVTELEYLMTGGYADIPLTIDFGPEGAKLSWEISESPGGIDLTNTKIDAGSETTDMKGTKENPDKPSEKLHLEAKAAAMPDRPDLEYETKKALLTLTATNKSTGEVVARTIRMVQKKYGMVLLKNELICTGEKEKILVKGNMPWRASIPTDDPGYVAALGKGMLDEYAQNDEGPAEELWFDPKGSLNFSTRTAPFVSDTPEMTVIFQHRTNGAIPPIEKKLKVMAGLYDKRANKLYKVYGPVKRSVQEKDLPYEGPDGVEVPGAVIMNYGQAQLLVAAAPNTEWEICRESEHKQEYRIADWPFVADREFVIPFLRDAQQILTESVYLTFSGKTIVRESQDLVSWTKIVGDPRHSAAEVKFTNTGQANMQVNIPKLGYQRSYNDNVWYHTDVKWKLHNPDGLPVAGDARFPCNVYGPAWTHSFKPDITTSYDVYHINLKRHGATGPLSTEPHKNKPYDTYYLLEVPM